MPTPIRFNMRKKYKNSLSLDWDNLVRLDRKVETVRRASKSMPKDYDEEDECPSDLITKPNVEFCTGSSYTGQWDSLGMCGYGTYYYPHGVEYEGCFKDGNFHGDGTLTFPMGQKIEATWNNGRIVTCKIRFADGLPYSEPWAYCKMPDRQYFVTLKHGLQPAGSENLTNEQPTRTIPDDCYDTVDGFYNPMTKCVVSPDLPSDEKDDWNKFLYIPTKAEEAWIIENCRKAWDEPIGHRPDLYEYWVTGRKAEMKNLKFDKREMFQNKESVGSFSYSSSMSSEEFDAEDDDSDRVYDQFQYTPE